MSCVMYENHNYPFNYFMLVCYPYVSYESYADDFLESENEVFMNTIRDNIANALISGG
jgi:hypothetical protein